MEEKNEMTLETIDAMETIETNEKEQTVNAFQPTTTTFEELGVSGEILQAIQEMGYVSPMPVQEKVIPYLLGHNNDVVALAQTGTGKTAAYGLPVLQKIDTNRTDTQAIIMGIDGLQQMPLTITIILCRGCWNESRSMTTHYHHLTIYFEHTMSCARNV